MGHVPHELAEVFPEQADAIHSRRAKDRRFDELCDRYHEVNRAIHRIEAGAEAASDERLEVLKKERLQMTDAVRTALAT